MVVKASGITAEIVVVDDNSPDQTGELVRHAFPGERVKVIIREGERGLATAIRRGINQASNEYLVLMDSDGNHDPEDLPRLTKELPKADIVIGSRYVKDGGMLTSRFRYIASYLFNLFVRIILGVPTRENLSGFLVFKKDLLKEFDLDKIFYGYGEYCIRFLYFAQLKGLKLLEVPVVYKFRLGGESKTRFLKYFVDYLVAVLRLRFTS